MIVFYIILLILTLIALIYVLFLVRPKAKKPSNEKLLTSYAHRGLHSDTVPENSLEAFSLAVQNGYGIELDVQLSSDGEVMVFHDYTLDRMTSSSGNLASFTKEQLCSLTLKGTEQRIPTLRQVLDLVDGRVPLLVELKGENFDADPLCEKVALLLRDYRGDYCIESFNPLMVRNIKKYLPDVYRGQLYSNACRDKKKVTPLYIAITCMAFNFATKPNFIAYNKTDRYCIPVKLTTRLYRAPNFVWTVKGEQEISEAIDLGEHPIFEQK